MDPVVDDLKRNCSLHGYGRKKWWADQLGIPPLTLSHWFAGRQSPSGRHALRIKEILDQAEWDKKSQVWKEYLWDSYYSKQPIAPKILAMVILEVLSISTLDSRTLALLSKIIEKEHPLFELPLSEKIKNRLGWLLEVSGQKPPFEPVRLKGTQPILAVLPKTTQLKQYLRRYQTRLGRKWHLYDCPLAQIKASLR